MTGCSLKNPDHFSFQFDHFKAEDNVDNSGDYIIDFQIKINANIQCLLSYPIEFSHRWDSNWFRNEEKRFFLGEFAYVQKLLNSKCSHIMEVFF